ncbi:MAG: type I DNA topoisomerase [Acutalibacteraceae bacterium]|nr:type I DNA topoisomerase [Acutalibacteraceae bacterium]
MSKLVIVESPTKVKSIKKYLGSGYEVMASMGHIRDLPKSKLGVDIEHDFKPQYVNMTDKKDLIKSLKEAAANSDCVLLATDPDREGEAISWHLAQILALDMNESNRVAFNEITESGVKAGIKEPRKINLDLVDAQQARRVLDRIVGYKLSPFLWKKVKSGLSAGRVQTVALRLIVEREREIERFNAEEYWSVDAKLLASRKSFSAKLHGFADGKKIDIIPNEEEAGKIVSALEGAEYRVSELKKGTRKKQPAPPFITSTLQQEASRKLGFTGQRTMRIAQQLYEGVDVPGVGTTGLITYMRTDSLRISEEARAAANKYISGRYGANYLPEKPRYFKTKSGAQDAHEAIRPTSVTLTPDSLKESLTAEQYKLYKLIWERFIASLMAVCVQNTVNVNITAGDYLFKASGYSVKFDGFTVLYEEGRDEDSEDGGALPEMKEGDILKLKELTPNQHFTQPPARYTEPTLIKALDENGIGRPSTYAPIISNILSRDYIEREKKSLKPTGLGTVVSDLMVEYFDKIVDVKFTAGLEEKLDEIGAGERGWIDTIKAFYKDFDKLYTKAESSLEGKRVKVPVEETDVVCEKCGRKMVIKSGRFGKFLACPGYPECKNTKPLPEDEVKQPCPKCGAKLLKKKSKKGKTFYGCSNYPNCDFAAPGIPTGETCPECGGYIISGIRGRKYCMNSECPTRAKKTAKKSGDKTDE